MERLDERSLRHREVMVEEVARKDDVDYFPRQGTAVTTDPLDVENGVSPDTVALLKRMGYQVDDAHPRVVPRVEAILISDGWLQGGHDGRGNGKADGY